jgi:L-lactate dehydrogenase complex protein LldG
MINQVRKALGRTEPFKNPPIPPEIPDSIARLAPRDANLPDLFTKSAAQAHFKIEPTTPDQIPSRIVAFLKLHQCQTIGIAVSPLLDNLKIEPAIRAANLTLNRWDETTLDSTYDQDCGITDVYAAVAETGSIVIRPNKNQGRALSLIPPIHIAIVEATNILPDLTDLMQKLTTDLRTPNITLITGPSKTADIEGALVTGVHGPGLVQIFLLP